MGLFLDSARMGEVRQAVELGFLAGVTTNPTLFGMAGGNSVRKSSNPLASDNAANSHTCARKRSTLPGCYAKW